MGGHEDEGTVFLGPVGTDQVHEGAVDEHLAVGVLEELEEDVAEAQDEGPADSAEHEGSDGVEFAGDFLEGFLGLLKTPRRPGAPARR